ncbi:MAG: NUDIX domain-containing protein [Candidatus Curtissbacteria bacterium]|nr:NUDIX domain-containing protein [Candidatus Curtissbacteria bacterium]
MIDPNNKSTTKNPVGHFMVAVGFLIELKRSGKILLVKRSDVLDWQPREWEIGYGRINQFEDTEVGLRREVFEELGLDDLEIINVLNIWHIFRGSMKAENELIGITYHCRTNTSEIRLSEEHSQYQWVLPEKAKEMVTVGGIKEDIDSYISSKM